MFATSIGGNAMHGKRLQGKGRHGVPRRLNCVIHAWALQSGLYTMQGAIQVLCFFIRNIDDYNKKSAHLTTTEGCAPTN